MAWNPARALPAVAIALCASCSGGSQTPNQTPADSGPTQPLDEAERLATIDASQAVFQANLGQPKAARDAALVAFFSAQPTVEAAGLSTDGGNVWVRFTDGTLYLDLDNVDPPPKAPVKGGGTGSAVAAARAQGLTDLPGNPSAWCVSSYEGGDRWSSEIGGWLTNAGYSVTTGGLTVDALLALQGAGVLYWETRSGQGTLRAASGTPPTVWALLTSTVASEALGQGAYKTMRDQQWLALMGVNVREGTGHRKEIRYAITEQFIRNWTGHLASAPLVAINAENSMQVDAAFAAAGAAHYVGVSGLNGIDGGPISPFLVLFDKLLGLDAAPGHIIPWLRPFPSQAIEPWMAQSGFDAEPGTSAKVQFSSHSANGDFAILIPTIFRVLNTAPAQNESFYKWTIEGTFGDKPGTVTYGGTPLEVRTWSNESISVKAPAAPIPSGGFQVAVGARKSPLLMVTDWSVPFTYTLTGKGTLQYVLHMDCRLRVDALGQRSSPFELEETYLPLPTWALDDTGGRLQASGSYTDPSSHKTVVWSGGGLIPWTGDSSAGPTNFATCQGLFVYSPPIGIAGSDNSAIQSFVLAAASHYSSTDGGDQIAGFLGITPVLKLGIDSSTMEIQAGSLHATGSLGTYGVSAVLEWPTTPPNYPPMDGYAR